MIRFAQHSQAHRQEPSATCDESEPHPANHPTGRKADSWLMHSTILHSRVSHVRPGTVDGHRLGTLSLHDDFARQHRLVVIEEVLQCEVNRGSFADKSTPTIT